MFQESKCNSKQLFVVIERQTYLSFMYLYVVDSCWRKRETK